ncbi:FecR family protein [Polaribacter batillariae]|uniref:FecR family protein n=1 Tax=Polaribacter batillariae TaxID=2808900 RepID=A0ABX7SWF7_9FLAO|nr:FecR family protein [Polaribacter batillariae]QTD38587.1 FecR family protein [Polaribacter batillariae]
MISNKVQNIIIKYLNKQASASELNALEEWLKEPSNIKEFNAYVKVNYLSDFNTKEFDAIASEKKILHFIAKDKKRLRLKKVTNFLKYAATIAIFVSLAYFYQQNNSKNKKEVALPSEKITLQTSNGKFTVLEEDGNFKIQDKEGNVIGSQKGDELVYEKKSEAKELIYNTLKVPYGKRFAIVLSDGTKVNLNAGTSFKYPVNFIEGKERQVFIESGEAYFDVTKDPKHPFIVNNRNMNVRVLGTQFNISSYPEDANITTVLVEGAVSLYNAKNNYNANNTTLLKPGFKANWNKKDSNIKVQKADIEIYTAWINGKILLKHMPFKSIIKKLERHYNVEIINNNKKLDNDFITATFETETIQEVFEVINEVHPINYTIEKNKIIIN